MEECKLVTKLVKLLTLSVNIIDKIKEENLPKPDTVTPKWLTPLLLLIDQYEKIACSCQRKAQVREVSFNHTRQTTG